MRLGLIGYGGFGRFSAEAFSQIPDVRVVAVADVAPASRALAVQRFGARVSTHAADVLNDPDVDIVVISTPPNTHAPLAIAAAERGKHIFCEKPLAISLPEADDVIAAVERNHVRLTLNYVMRHNPLNHKLAALLRTGVLGPLHHLSLENWATDEPIPPGHWFWDPAQSGGIWVEHSVHFFDLFAWLSGARAEAATAIGRRRANGDRDREWAIVRYSDGLTTTYHHAFTQAQRFEQTTIRLACARGYVTLQGWIQTYLILDALVDDEGVDIVRGWAGVEPEVLERYTGPAQEGWAFGGPYRVSARLRVELALPHAKMGAYTEAIRAGMQDLIAAVRDPHHTLVVTPMDGWKSLAVALAAVRASQTGCWEDV